MDEGTQIARPTSKRGEETRARLLNAAREQFAQDGFDGASLRMIAASADITLALLHYHFGSKRDLYRAVWVDQYSSDDERRRRSAYASAAVQGETREEALRRVLGAAIAGPVTLLQDKRGSEFITILARELADPKAPERGLLDEFINPVSQETQAALRAIMLDLPEDGFRTGVLMTVAATQQLIHHSTLAAIKVDVGSVDALPALVPAMIEFLVQGWRSLQQ